MKGAGARRGRTRGQDEEAAAAEKAKKKEKRKKTAEKAKKFRNLKREGRRMEMCR